RHTRFSRDWSSDVCSSDLIRRALAQAHSYAGEFSEAIERSREAIAIAEDAGETVQAARARLGLMHAYAETGRYEQAIEIGEEAQRMLMAAGEPALAARADLNLGGTHQIGRAH